jgi:hypothetical protein
VTEMEQGEPIQCCFCRKEVESIEKAIDLGWYPDFWRGNMNYQGPVCTECQAEHLVLDEDGEFVLKPDHALPPLAEPQGVVKLRKSKAALVVKPKFSLGQVVATPGALRALEGSGQTPAFFLDRHVQGDWGTVDAEDWAANDQALVDGSRILSAYKTLKGKRLWIITEADRSSTCCLLPEEY